MIGFIELTLFDHRLKQKVLLNVGHIMVVREDTDGMGIVETCDGVRHYVIEDYEQVTQLIHKALGTGIGVIDSSES